MDQALTYFKDIGTGIRTLWSGFRLILYHIWKARHTKQSQDVRSPEYFAQSDGIVTTRYPYEAIPIPDNGRYRLHNEIDDCIVCDLCAKVCPVNCIDIQVIKSPVEIGKTSDGSSKRLYAATFDIDMAKCCYCGLCTTVCPTECLTMTKTFDYSEFDIRNMNYHFTNLSPEEAEEKRKIYEEAEKEKLRIKEQLKKEKEPSEKSSESKPGVKPVFKPSIPKKSANESIEKKEVDLNVSQEKTTPGAEPTNDVPKETTITTDIKPSESEPQNQVPTKDVSEDPKPKPKVVFKPVIPKPKPKSQDDKPSEE
ncbi:MAG: 4Fe-4S binding protein [Cytophagaceae bacterium]|nr:4Fe-4S binding protein [Cytophagaceae bacterium]